MGLTLAAAAVQVNASYVLSIAGVGTTFPDRDPGVAWGVLPGGEFQVAAVLSGSPTDLLDFAIFDVGVTGPRSLIDNKYLWDAKFTTGGIGTDDSSIPRAVDATGVLALGKPLIDAALYPFGPAGRADVHFENVVTLTGSRFNVGTLVTLNLKVPANAVIGEQYVITPIPDTFCPGFDCDTWHVGSPLHITVVPEPTTLALVALGAILAILRRSKLLDLLC